ncbi:MAG TPA: TIGR01777 family oxidoreductase [Candidatus Dormibacteraeota bacterium]|nr:TIGR01777 family oxidoreductase [Candidatus Dormibacteraeota bacterium]
MKIAVTGSSGLVGSALVPHLAEGGHQVVRLVRSRTVRPAEIAWDPEGGTIDSASLEGLGAVVHLAGESIADGRWTEAKKNRIRHSRVGSTRLLAATIAGLSRPPQVLVCASAVGYYGDRGDEPLREDSPPGGDFLAGVCRAWEGAAEAAARKGVRVVHQRFGMILSPAGGALARMLPPYRLGAGGPIGTGRQYVSWIALDDVLGAIGHALTAGTLRGPINTVSPHPVTNRDFSRVFGRVLHRPAILPMPAFAARLVFGEMADALLLSSQRVEPARLLASGYRFLHPDLEPALRHLLGRAGS